MNDEEFVELLAYIRSLPANARARNADAEDVSGKLLMSALDAHLNLDSQVLLHCLYLINI